MGVKVTFKPVDWDGIILSLKNKDIDVILNGLTITDIRKKQIAFSNVYVQNKQIIIVNSKSTIASKSALSGKTVGLQLGSSSETALDKDTTLLKSVKEVKKYSEQHRGFTRLKRWAYEMQFAREISDKIIFMENGQDIRKLNS